MSARPASVGPRRRGDEPDLARSHPMAAFYALRLSFPQRQRPPMPQAA